MNNLTITIVGIIFIFLMTTLGSAVVFFFKREISSKLNTLFLGFAAGVMVAASIWSLLLPALDEAKEQFGSYNWLPAIIGFLVGGLFIVLLDKIIPHLHKGTNLDEGPHTSLRKSTKLFLAVTIHNIPEGLAVGFAFGLAASQGTNAAFIAALGLAIGIGIQNFPEGAAISLPMKNATGKRLSAFLYGMGSGVVEPMFALVGYFLAAKIGFMQPWLLSFAAGAMIFVVAEDLIPDAKLNEHPHLGTWGVMIGFAVMMILDVALG